MINLDYQPLVSIIIPTRNEAEDIAQTLINCIALDYERKEIIIIDDSSDETINIINSFKNKEIKLIHREKNANACCGARLRGIQEAHGEIIVLLNADARLKSNFLNEILKHYSNGADFVTVRSQVKNYRNRWGKFMYCREQLYYKTGKNISWSEGFSFRKSIFELVNSWPGDYPVPFCRDWLLAKAFENSNFNHVIDLNIVVEHIWPGTFLAFWKNQMGKGTFSSPYVFYYQNFPTYLILLREILKTGKMLFQYVLIIPTLFAIIQLTRVSSGGWSDLPDIFLGYVVNDIARTIGNYKGWIRVARMEGFCIKYK